MRVPLLLTTHNVKHANGAGETRLSTTILHLSNHENVDSYEDLRLRGSKYLKKLVSQGKSEVSPWTNLVSPGAKSIIFTWFWAKTLDQLS